MLIPTSIRIKKTNGTGKRKNREGQSLLPAMWQPKYEILYENTGVWRTSQKGKCIECEYGWIL